MNNKKMGLFKFEMLNLFRNKQSLFVIILLPILVFWPLILGVMNLHITRASTPVAKEVSVAFSRTPEGELLGAIEEIKEEYNINIKNVTNYKRALNNREVVAYFYIGEEEEKPFYRIYADETNKDNIEVIRCLENIVLDYNNRVRNAYHIKDEQQAQVAGYEFVQIDPKYTLTSVSRDIIGEPLTNALPYIIILLTTIACMYSAMKTRIDRENRGSMEAILSAGVTTRKYVNNKYIVVASVGVINTIISIVTIIISGVMVYLVNGPIVSSLIQKVEMKYEIVHICIILIYIVSVMVMIAMGIGAISVYIFSGIKKHSSIVSIILLIGEVIALTREIYTTIYIPAYSRQFEEFLSRVPCDIVCLTSTIVIIIYIVIKLIDTDRALFEVNKTKSIWDIRNSIKKGGVPTPILGLLILPIMVKIYSYLPEGINLDIIDAVIIILLTWLFKLSIKNTYLLRIPTLKKVIGGICILISFEIMQDIVNIFMIKILPIGQNIQPHVEETINSSKNIFEAVFVIAVVTGILEEITYRGFLLSGLRNNKKNESTRKMLITIIISGVIFGFMHGDVRIIPGISIMGIGLSYVAYRSECIYIGIAYHIIHNWISTLTMYDPSNELLRYYYDTLYIFPIVNIKNILIILALIIIGVMLLKPSKKINVRKINKPVAEIAGE